MPCQGIAPAPQEECGGLPPIPPQGPVPVTGVFPAGVYLHLLETGIQAIQLSPYRADLPARRPIRLGTAAGFLACYFPRSPFRARSAIRSRDISSQSLPAARAIQQCASWRTRSDVKPAACAYVGSNPAPATQNPRSKPVTRNCVTGFCVQRERFIGPSAAFRGLCVGRIRPSAGFG